LKSLKEQLKPIKPQARPARVLPVAIVAAPEPEPDFPTLMRDVRPLKPDGRVQAPMPRPRPRPLHHAGHRLHDNHADHTLFAQMLGWFEPAHIDIEHRSPGMPAHTLKKLRAGHWPVCAELDLHGHDTRASACASFTAKA